MVRLAQALVDTSECAEEIVQDAFIKVCERWDRLGEPGGYARITVINGAAASYENERSDDGSGSESARRKHRQNATT